MGGKPALRAPASKSVWGQPSIRTASYISAVQRNVQAQCCTGPQPCLFAAKFGVFELLRSAYHPHGDRTTNPDNVGICWFGFRCASGCSGTSGPAFASLSTPVAPGHLLPCRAGHCTHHCDGPSRCYPRLLPTA